MKPLLEVQGLEVTFSSSEQSTVVLDRIDLSLYHGEILGIVGESGSGKSVTSLSIMGLLGTNGGITHGTIFFEGENLLDKTEKELNQIRGTSLTMIFQDPMASLNPLFTIGFQLTESLRIHKGLSRKDAKSYGKSLLEKVGLTNPESLLKKYPHTLSGGMRQRVMIAIALACQPKVLIADEPTTALDVTIQAQIMRLLKELKEDLGMSILLITHDLGLIAEMADRVLVMYAGQIVEEATVEALFENPSHPYTVALMNSIPKGYKGSDQKLTSIPGTVPQQYDKITGCRFQNRCEYAHSQHCHVSQPRYEIEDQHYVRCWRNTEEGRNNENE